MCAISFKNDSWLIEGFNAVYVEDCRISGTFYVSTSGYLFRSGKLMQICINCSIDK